MSELTNWRRELRSKSRISEIVYYITHPIPCLEAQKHLARKWGLSTRTVQIFTVAAVKEGKIARLNGWYVPVEKK